MNRKEVAAIRRWEGAHLLLKETGKVYLAREIFGLHMD